MRFALELLAGDFCAADRGRGARRGRGSGPGGQAGDELGRHQHVRRVRGRHPVHYQMGGLADQVGSRFLHCGRRYHRLPERIGDRRRLHVGRIVSWHLRGRDGHRIRWPDLLHRLSGRLAGDHVPDGGAPAQSGQVHLCRRCRLSLPADTDPHVRRVGNAGRRRVLPDRPDGGCRRADQVAVRSGLLDCRCHRRRA